jgi:hypothetical protein
MGLKDELSKAVHNVGDALHEAGHKTRADAERADREIAGDTMTPGEKVGSVVSEGKERLLGDVDHAKRDVRNNT